MTGPPTLLGGMGIGFKDLMANGVSGFKPLGMGIGFQNLMANGVSGFKP